MVTVYTKEELEQALKAEAPHILIKGELAEVIKKHELFKNLPSTRMPTIPNPIDILKSILYKILGIPTNSQRGYKVKINPNDSVELEKRI